MNLSSFGYGQLGSNVFFPLRGAKSGRPTHLGINTNKSNLFQHLRYFTTIRRIRIRRTANAVKIGVNTTDQKTRQTMTAFQITIWDTMH